MLNDKKMDEAQCGRKIVTGAIKILMNVNGNNFECFRVLNEGMLLQMLMYCSITMYV